MRLSRLGHRLLLCLGMLLLAGMAAWAQTENLSLPELNLPDIKIEPTKGSTISPNLQVMFFTTSLSLIPYLVVSCTAFIRVTITLSYMKSALGSPQALSPQLMMGICLIFTSYIMAPVAQRVNTSAIQPYLAGTIEQPEFLVKGVAPLREFMFYQTRTQDIELMMRLGRFRDRPKKIEDIPFQCIYPAFIMSEVKTGFMIGFMIYLPFLVIDMLVAATLMSMGMFMISPSSISVPFKLLMWVSIDGWHIIIKGLMLSFNRPEWMGKVPI